MKRIMFLMLILFSRNIFCSDKVKGIEGSIRIAQERYLFKGRDNLLKFYDENNDFNLVIKIDKKDKDSSSIIFVDNLKKYYIVLTKREINSISVLKNLFSSKNIKEKNYQIRGRGSKNIIGFEFNEYCSSTEIGEMNLFFSKELTNYIKKFIIYDDFINMIKDIDFSGIPYVDMYFEMSKYLINRSLELGFIGQIYMSDEELYSICSIEDSNIRDEELELPKNYEKKGIDSFLNSLQ